MDLTLEADALSVADHAALQELAERLWETRAEIGAEWARRLATIVPDQLGAEISVDDLARLNERFLSLVLEQIQLGDWDGLYSAFYELNRQLIEADLERAPATRVSLAGLYTSARISLAVISERLGDNSDRLVLAYAKLTAQLMMLVGRAYSDAREEYLQRTFERVTTVSHELRAPLSHLFGYLELLRAGEFGAVTGEQERVLTDLIRETDELHWLLTGMLDLSRLDAGRVTVRVEQIDLTALLDEVVQGVPHPDVTITCSAAPDLPPLRSDRVKLKQILGNILRNSVRHGGGANIRLAAGMPQPGSLEIVVRDYGPGIAPEDLQAIFDLLERGHAATLAPDGYGIGLHVVRRLTALLGGTITVESAPGEGACFRLTLPQNAPSGAST
jgi:signal transduction histidine kinase